MPATILILDDEPALNAALRMFLEDQADYVIRQAYSGEEALGLVSELCPDLCIVDLRLPGISGEEFILSAADCCPACSFIIHTGDVGYSEESLSRLEGRVAGIFRKPVVDLDAFLQTIAKALGDRA